MNEINNIRWPSVTARLRARRELRDEQYMWSVVIICVMCALCIVFYKMGQADAVARMVEMG